MSLRIKTDTFDVIISVGEIRFSKDAQGVFNPAILYISYKATGQVDRGRIRIPYFNVDYYFDIIPDGEDHFVGTLTVYPKSENEGVSNATTYLEFYKEGNKVYSSVVNLPVYYKNYYAIRVDPDSNDYYDTTPNVDVLSDFYESPVRHIKYTIKVTFSEEENTGYFILKSKTDQPKAIYFIQPIEFENKNVEVEIIAPTPRQANEPEPIIGKINVALGQVDLIGRLIIVSSESNYKPPGEDLYEHDVIMFKVKRLDANIVDYTFKIAYIGKTIIY